MKKKLSQTGGKPMTKVLVAEDDRFLMSAYRVKFIKAGFDLLQATDGEETLNLLHSQHVDVLLLDLIMPNKDGFAVLVEMQRDPILKKIPVIIASNLGQKEDLDKALSLGAVDYVVKSDMSMDNLVEKVNAVVTKYKQT